MDFRYGGLSTGLSKVIAVCYSIMKYYVWIANAKHNDIVFLEMAIHILSQCSRCRVSSLAE